MGDGMLRASSQATVPYPRYLADGTGRDLYKSLMERCASRRERARK